MKTNLKTIAKLFAPSFILPIIVAIPIIIYKFGNPNLSSAISSTATIISVMLTFFIWKATKNSTEIAKRLENLEIQREYLGAYIWFNGYNSSTNEGSFVMQNSGKRSIFFRSLKISSNNMTVQKFTTSAECAKDCEMTTTNELLDVVITPEKVTKFSFKFKEGHGQNFMLSAQLYAGDTVNIVINTDKSSGYEYRVTNNCDLAAYFNCEQLDVNGLPKIKRIK